MQISRQDRAIIRSSLALNRVGGLLAGVHQSIRDVFTVLK
jgi:hypothetical protein